MKRLFEKCKNFALLVASDPAVMVPALIVFVLMAVYSACLFGLMLDNAIMGR